MFCFVGFFVYFGNSPLSATSFTKIFSQVYDLCSHSLHPNQFCSLALRVQQTHVSLFPCSRDKEVRVAVEGTWLPKEMCGPGTTIHFQPMFIHSLNTCIVPSTKSHRCIGEQNRQSSKSCREHLLLGKTY